MVDESNARALLAAAGVGGKPELTPLSGGTVNQAFRVESGDEPLILRIAPSDAEVSPGPSWLSSHGLRREQEVLRLLADQLAGLIPETVRFDESRTLIDRDWVLQTVIPGHAWEELLPQLDARERDTLWRHLGEITARVHAVVGTEFGPPEAGFGTATWSDLVRWDVTGFTVDAGRFGIDPAPMEALQSIVDDAASLLDHVHEPRLIHSDLGLNHVFIAPGKDGQHRITGIIDWEYGRFADPQSESIFVQHTLSGRPDDELAAFCQGYGCPGRSHEAEIRMTIYQLVALGWTVTDMARQGLQDAVADVLAQMEGLLHHARRMV
jgi:aminoglycoside phosphotransferase (APT) family kinase protein